MLQVTGTYGKLYLGVCSFLIKWHKAVFLYRKPHENPEKQAETLRYSIETDRGCPRAESVQEDIK